MAKNSQFNYLSLDYKYIYFGFQPKTNIKSYVITAVNTVSEIYQKFTGDAGYKKGDWCGFDVTWNATSYEPWLFKCVFTTDEGDEITESFVLRPLTQVADVNLDLAAIVGVKGTTVTANCTSANPLTSNTVTCKLSLTDAMSYDYIWEDHTRPTKTGIYTYDSIHTKLLPNWNMKLCTWETSSGGEYGPLHVYFLTTEEEQLTITYNDQGTLKKASVYFNDAGTIKTVLEGYTNVNGELKQIKNS